MSIATEQKVEKLLERVQRLDAYQERVRRLEAYVIELAEDLRKTQEQLTELRNGRKK